MILLISSTILQELFVNVVPFHCLGCIWSQRDKKENRNLAPTVRATISQFNAVTNRVITSLLCPSSPSPSTSSPVLSPSSTSNFLYPSSAPGSPHRSHTSPVHRARIIEWWIAVAQVRIHTNHNKVQQHVCLRPDLESKRHRFSTGVQTAEELLLFESHSVSPAVQRHLSPQEDVGRCEQVGWHFQEPLMIMTQKILIYKTIHKLKERKNTWI